ncbi:transposase family protein [Streptomyces sp. NPDC054834]
MSVARVERLADGGRRVHLVTADETARACPACGVFATRVKGSAVSRPRDLPYGESGLELRWHKPAGGAARPAALAGPSPSRSRRSRPVPG